MSAEPAGKQSAGKDGFYVREVTVIPPVKHHGYWLRQTTAAQFDNFDTTFEQQELSKSKAEELVTRLYGDAETRQEKRNEPLPNRYPQGGLVFEFEADKNQYKTVRKPALEMSKSEYKACLLNQYEKGITKRKEKMQQLYDKYCPTHKIDVEALQAKPTRG